MTKVKFPANLLFPIGKLLNWRLSSLEKKKKSIEDEDPFKDTERLNDNASPDTDAAEQFGHARTTALKNELARKIIQTKKALTNIKVGTYGICEDCKKMIDTDRLMVYPEATLCVSCEKKREK
ncbi:MAG: TraR/DksA C4-type zinc finger protein [Candidatus Woesebacteria bacterium]|nr:TraR/DksA C4-type zinc finger protein [Candidatus Woesebacteria bacterium]